jgi:hypothetical protein
LTEDNPYYDGLGQYELAYGTSSIVLIEAVWYCKSLDKEYIRYSHLKKISNDSLLEKTNGDRTDFGGNYDKIIRHYEREGFFNIKKFGRKETRIYPNILLIEEEIKCMRIENLRSSNKVLYRLLWPGDTIIRRRRLLESVKISEKLNVTVTRANQKETKFVVK